ncbi:PQQ-dependent sugar dehydrogenase [Parasedimentitalea marina]|uniref:PQQ-dependent sugar dehydrogenase n=2 Tax=Parasedimentitalea marina TaxID=2483033 RepID=A0A3T0N8Q1_9RHOB|nr:PQQ-dependent sugar dehydrogenase [Parasedimentitalea marina]
MQVTQMANGFDVPWAIAFLPGGAVLVTDRNEGLYIVNGAKNQKIKGTPKVVNNGQGGLLDVMVPRDFPISREIFMTFSKRQGLGSGTALAVATLSSDIKRLSDLRILFEAAPSSSTSRHYGSRIIEAQDGSLFMTLGERGQKETAQDLSLHQGSIIHLNRDGSAFRGNPFINEPTAQPHIWSYGHRNPQGLALDSKGGLWAVEHGAQGGDEINEIQKGNNYGWPVISYGRHYSGAQIGEGRSKTGMQQPSWYWDPSIAPSGMMIYSGKLWPNWRGHFFVGSLKFDYISRLSGRNLSEKERLQSPRTGRIRDVVEAPDGSIWFASETDGAIFRLAPSP